MSLITNVDEEAHIIKTGRGFLIYIGNQISQILLEVLRNSITSLQLPLLDGLFYKRNNL